MKIEVTEHGGVLGVDRRYSIDGSALVVFDKGHQTLVADLDAGEEATLVEMGTKAVAEPSVTPVDMPPSDALTTVITVADQTSTKTFTHQSGQPMPAAAKALVRRLKASAGEAGTT